MSTSRTGSKKWVGVVGLGLAMWLLAPQLGATTALANQIQHVIVGTQGGKTKVIVRGSQRPMYTAFKLSTPKRLVIDVANSTLKGVPKILDASTDLVSGVAVSAFTTGKVPVSRIMINFRKEAAYRVKVKGNQLVITLQGGPPSKARDKSVEQVISMANTRQEVAKIRAQADALVEKTRDEASREVAVAQKRAADANDKWRQAKAELDALKRDQQKNEARLDEAKREVAKAKRAYERLKAMEAKKMASRRFEATRALEQQRRKAEREINMLKRAIAQANELAASEQASRKKLEARLAGANKRLKIAQKAAQEAMRARKEAEQIASSLKDKVKAAFIAREKARKEANAARQELKAADQAYRTASKAEKAKLYEQLQQKQRETVLARKRFVEARSAHDRMDEKLEAALVSLRQANARNRRAQKEGEEARVAYQAKQKELEQELARARKTAEQAVTRAATAEKEKKQLQRKLARLQKDATRATQEVDKKASEAVRDAKSRMARAQADAKALKVRYQKTEKQVAALQKALESAKETIARQNKRISSLEASAVNPRAQAKAANSAKAITVEKTVVGEPTRPLTQEEIRLARLAQMNPGMLKKKKSEPTGVSHDNSVKPESASNLAAIQDIRFVNRGAVQKIVIQGDGKIEFAKKQQNNRTFVMKFKKTRLLPMLERTLDVRDFGGAIGEITSAADGDEVKIQVILSSRAKNRVETRDGAVEWIFEDVDASGRNKVAPLGANTRVVHREQSNPVDYPSERTAAYSVTLADLSNRPHRYSGRRIDLDFKSADIHNILRLLADVGHVNIVTSNDVSGEVTIRMRDVPWDQALDVILQTKGLGKVRQGNLIRVAPMTVLEAEYEKAIERMKMNKELKPLETRLIPISYAQAKELKAQATDLLSDRGKLSVDNRTNVIIARDVPEILDQIEALLRNLDTQTPQVLIEGRIVEATSTYAREIGIQWGGDFSASAATGNPTGLAFPSTVGLAGGATDNATPIGGLTPVAGGQPNPNFAVNLPAAVGTGSGGALGISLGSIANNANLNLRLSALEEEGTLRILSSPKVLTLDNREAHIEQGTMIPYSRVSANGVQTAFKEAKLNLTVTPHVTADGSILLNISMTRDEPDFNNKGAGGDPTILKREAETELLVNDGHTAVIGGIFTRNHGRSYKKVPFFGDIPILGWLFKSRTDSDRRSEMLIFITPTIVNRAESIGQ